MKRLIILICLLCLHNIILAQVFSGGEAYSSEFDDYLSDFIVSNDEEYQLIKQKLFTYPETVYASMLHGLDIIVNPLYLGSEFSSLKLSLDDFGNVYLAGIYNQKIINDSSFLFISKLDKSGVRVWTRLFEKRSDSIDIFNDGLNHVFVHDKHVLYKFDYEGTLIWAKEHTGIIKLYKNCFYEFIPCNVYKTYISGKACDSLVLQKFDISGNQIFQKTINVRAENKSKISTNCFINIVNDKIFLSNSYWGKINVSPPDKNYIFENTRTIDLGEWGHGESFDNYLAIYDTLGNLQFANSKIKFPRFDYACNDSAGSLYFAGNFVSNLDFNLQSGDSIIVKKSAKDISFITKYSSDLDFIWCRGLTGLIKYIGVSHYKNTEVEKLDVAGDYEGTINLNLERPKVVVFTSIGRDMFFAKYTDLNDNISPSNIETSINDKSISIYPNPCKGILNISGNFSKMQIEVFDISGDLKYSNNLFSDSSIKTLDLSHLISGCYIIRIKCNDKIYTNKLLINNE